MPVQIEQWDPDQMLQPMQRPEDARQDALRFGPSLTIAKGDLIAISTATTPAGLAVPYAVGGANGTGTAKAISMYPFKTDANGKVYFGSSTGVADIRVGPSQTAPCWICGIFDPADLFIAGVATTASVVVTAFGGLARTLHNGFVKVL